MPDFLYGFLMVSCSFESFVALLHVYVHSDLLLMSVFSVITTSEIQELCASGSTSSILFCCRRSARCSLSFTQYAKGVGRYGAATVGTE